jgi:plastocyanin
MKLKLLVLIGTIIALVAGFVLLRSESAGQHREPTTKTFTLVVRDRKLVSGPETLTVRQGDTVDIKITVSENEELHLHGYDKHVDLEKDKPGELKFTADLTGSFPYELEHSATEIGHLQVEPR